MTATIVKGGDLLPGDVLASGSTITGYLSIVKGGAQYAIVKPNGDNATITFDRRRNFTVDRPERHT